MKAFCIVSRPELGGLSAALQERELPLPEPARNEVRIRVEASTINIDDVHMAEGTMFGGLPVSPRPTENRPYIPGTDVAGIVDAVGPGADKYRIGQAVYGTCNPVDGRGPWAEYCIAKVRSIAPIPEQWDFPQAAASALAGGVVVSMLKAAGDLTGKRCVVVGASGGIGTLCVQALAAQNARVWAVCSARNSALVESLGAERILDYSTSPFNEQIGQSGERADIVFDLIGGKETEKSAYSILEPNGRFITVVGPQKYVGEKNIGVKGALGAFAYVLGRSIWTRVSGAPKYSLCGPTGFDADGIGSTLAFAGCRPVFDSVVPFRLQDFRDALGRVLDHRAAGKIVLSLASQGEQQ